MNIRTTPELGDVPLSILFQAIKNMPMFILGIIREKAMSGVMIDNRPCTSQSVVSSQ